MNFYHTYGSLTFTTTCPVDGDIEVSIMRKGIMLFAGDSYVFVKYRDMTLDDIDRIALIIEDYRIQCEQAQQQQYEYEAALRAYERAQARYEQVSVNMPDYTF